MTAQEFCYWLQGRAELLPDQPPTADEWKMIREHLSLVFKKVTPPKAEPNPLDYSRQYEQQRIKPAPFMPSQPFDSGRVYCKAGDSSLPPQAIC